MPVCQYYAYIEILDEREMEAMDVDKRQTTIAESVFDGASLHAVLLEARGPVLEASRRHFQARFDGETVPEARFITGGGPGKERQVGAGTAFRVSVKEVVGAGVVLVHRSLHQMHAQDAGVEIHVLLRRTSWYYYYGPGIAKQVSEWMIKV